MFIEGYLLLLNLNLLGGKYMLNQYIDNIVQIITAKTGNKDKAFFEPVAAYYLCKVASNLRASVQTERGLIPVNAYAICLGTSGYGKGQSINIIEDDILSKFKTIFIEQTLGKVTETNIIGLEDKYSFLLSSNTINIQEKYKNIIDNAGSFVFSFDSGTAPAVKQLRSALCARGIGALSSEQDEIGSNLTNNVEILNLFLELYDLGKAKQKLIKHTKEQARAYEPDGRVPTNLLMFGTPSTVFDGGIVEDKFYDLLETGYARRCLFGYGTKQIDDSTFSKTAAEIYDERLASVNTKSITDLQEYFASFADEKYANLTIEMPRDVGIRLVQYQQDCLAKVREFKEHEILKSTEMEHRYFKALKLAGAFTFVDKRTIMTSSDIEEAIYLVEKSGESFNKFLSRDKPYVKLAKYIASCDTPVNAADILEALPWCSGSKLKELTTYAIAWGYSNNTVIRRELKDGIEFYSNVPLEHTDLNNLILSVGTDTTGFEPRAIAFDALGDFLTKSDPINIWCNHYFSENHRDSKHLIKGFNCIVLDIDGTTTLEHFQNIFPNYKYVIHTTKRFSSDSHRFRVIIPLKYKLSLDRDTYTKFISNILSWLPFDIDLGCKEPERRWCGVKPDLNPIVIYSKYEELFDPLRFIPKTSRNDEMLAFNKTKIKHLDNIQLYFLGQAQEGNRNNTLFKYMALLVDNGLSKEEVRDSVVALNKELDIPLSTEELKSTIFKSMENKYNELT